MWFDIVFSDDMIWYTYTFLYVDMAPSCIALAIRWKIAGVSGICLCREGWLDGCLRLKQMWPDFFEFRGDRSFFWGFFLDEKMVCQEVRSLLAQSSLGDKDRSTVPPTSTARCIWHCHKLRHKVHQVKVVKECHVARWSQIPHCGNKHRSMADLWRQVRCEPALGLVQLRWTEQALSGRAYRIYLSRSNLGEI